MNKQYGFAVDVERCIGCYSCAMACKNQNQLDPGMTWRKLFPLDESMYPHAERAFYSLACNHCEHPVCAASCPVTAYHKRPEDGVVIHDLERCIGCQNCIRSCPYGAPSYNPELEKAQKCSFCHERLDAGREPACVQGCPTAALDIIDVQAFDDQGMVRYPPGFPRAKQLNPSTRFRNPKQPRVIRRTT